MADTALVKLDAARKLLAEANAAPDLKALHDNLASVQQWLKRRGFSLDVQKSF